MELSELHGKRLAVVLSVQGQHRVLRGTAHYVKKAKHSLLQVELDGAENWGGARLILDEHEWTHEITAGSEYECEFCIRIGMRGSI